VQGDGTEAGVAGNFSILFRKKKIVAALDSLVEPLLNKLDGDFDFSL